MLDIGDAIEESLARKRAYWKKYNRTRFNKRLAEDPDGFRREMRDTSRKRRQDPIFRAKEREQDKLRKRKKRAIEKLPSGIGELSTALPLEATEGIGETEKAELCNCAPVVGIDQAEDSDDSSADILDQLLETLNELAPFNEEISDEMFEQALRQNIPADISFDRAEKARIYMRLRRQNPEYRRREADRLRQKRKDASFRDVERETDRVRRTAANRLARARRDEDFEAWKLIQELRPLDDDIDDLSAIGIGSPLLQAGVNVPPDVFENESF
jgi:hypothetical protein